MSQLATYPRRVIGLHWLMAVGIAGTLALGLYMHDQPLSPDKLKLYAWHKWAGVSLFLLLLVRLAWRLTLPMPANDVLAWQQRVASVVHGLLYILMLAVPLSGWLMSSAKGFQTVWFGLLPLPDLLGKDAALAERLGALHRFLSYSLAGLVLAHVLGALKHHFVDHDEVLKRMLPFLK